jgi:hypothetical protein
MVKKRPSEGVLGYAIPVFGGYGLNLCVENLARVDLLVGGVVDLTTFPFGLGGLERKLS